MQSTPNPIRLSASEDALLRRLYLRFRIPRDQFKKRPEDLKLFAQKWEDLSGRRDSGPELVRYMQNQQKAKKRLKVPWPVFEGKHKRAPAIAGTLSDDQMDSLRLAYETVVLPHGVGTDAAFWNDELNTALEAEFTQLTGRIVPGALLMAAAEEKRKRGLWFTVGRSGYGFGDLGQLRSADDGDE